MQVTLTYRSFGLHRHLHGFVPFVEVFELGHWMAQKFQGA